MSAPTGRRGGAASALLGLLAVAVIAGVMITVGIAPAIALTGVGASNGISLFENLPSETKISALQQKTEIYANLHGKKVRIASFFNQNREVLKWDEVGQAAKNAAVAGEDQRFYEHGGVDPLGIARALVKSSNGNQQGGSTITQQYVKNVCIQKAELLSKQSEVTKAYDVCTLPSAGRKIKEARLAIGLEKKYSKNDILLGYLNIAPFGGNVYGIESAAKYYFDVHAKDLSNTQAASLLAIVNEPNYYRLDDKAHLAAAQGRRDYVLGKMRDLKMISPTEYDTDVAAPIKTKITPTLSGCQGAGVSGFFCDYVSRVILQNKAYGKTADDRAVNLMSAGWKVYTTLNLDLQRKAQKTMNTWVSKKPSAGNIGSAATSIQVGTGRILTMVQNKNYSLSKGRQNTVLNYNTDQAYGGSAGFQPGSTFKMFTLVDWLKQGNGLYDVVNGRPRTMAASDFTQCGSTYAGDSWTFRNDESSEDRAQTVMEGTAQSVNGVFASMASKLDLCDIRKTAQSLGVHTASGAPIEDYPPFVIGQASTFSPMTMANAYAGIAAKGVSCKPLAIDSVLQADGKPLKVPKKSCTQGVDHAVAVAAAYALHGVVTGVGGTLAQDRPTDGAYEMGKTGTTDNAYDTWAVGATSRVATAVWVGGVSGRYNLRGIYSFKSCHGSGGQAANTRHCIWQDMMAANNKAYPPATSWEQPESRFLTGKQMPVPNVVGKSVSDAKQVLTAAGFDSKVGADVPSSDVQQGMVASTDPGAGASSSGGTVVLHKSAGAAPAQPQTGQVPNVVGQKLADARNALSGAGFGKVGVTYVPSAGNSCLVGVQQPSAGSQAQKDAPVTVAVVGNQQQCG